ncbi:MAG: hypothetical protein IJ906_08015 [Oscillospiraceae bacterium]|nr:hypothetical protein [Oscillospiraceae bacterium]
MRDLFFICCTVVVLVQAGVTFLRWLVEKLDRHGHEVIAYVLGILLTGGVLAVKLPFIHDPLVEALKPMFVSMDFTPFLYLLEFTVVTTVLRMLFEHFVLHLRYKKWEWLAFGLVFVFFTYWTFRVTFLN